MSAPQWYYEDGGRARGPVTRDQLLELLIHAFVPPSTRVWTPAFGDEWRAADQTELMPRPPVPPPLPPKGAGEGQARDTTIDSVNASMQPLAPAASGKAAGVRKALVAGDPAEPGEGPPAAALSPANGITQPPRAGHTPAQPWGRAANLGGEATRHKRPGRPVPDSRQPTSDSASLLTEDDLAGPPSKGAGSAALSPQHSTARYVPPGANKPLDTFAQLLAFSPLIVAALDLLIAVAGNDPNGDSPIARALPLWITVGTIVLAAMDSRRVTDHGLNPQRRTLAPFVLLTPIAYFIRRNGVLPGSLRFLWIWLASLLGFLVIEIAIEVARG